MAFRFSLWLVLKGRGDRAGGCAGDAMDNQCSARASSFAVSGSPLPFGLRLGRPVVALVLPDFLAAFKRLSASGALGTRVSGVVSPRPLHPIKTGRNCGGKRSSYSVNKINNLGLVASLYTEKRHNSAGPGALAPLLALLGRGRPRAHRGHTNDATLPTMRQSPLRITRRQQ